MGKQRRRPRGTGGLRHDAARGLWVGRVIVGRYPSGKPKYREVTHATQAGCVRLMAAVEPLPATTTLAAFAERWHRDHGGKPATRNQYAASLRKWLVPEFGHLKLSDVTPGRVEGLAAKMRAEGKEPATVTGVLACLRALLMAALRDGLISRNPVSVARKPKKVKKKIDVFTPGELSRLIAAATGHTLPVALLAATGMRIGESVALDVTDFDPRAGTVSITKTTSVHGTGTPKSANGVRTIRVPAAALPSLVAAVGGRAAGPLYRDDRGRRLTDRRCRDAWYPLLVELGLRRRTPHALRHAYCTLSLAAGVPIADLAKYVGDAPLTIMGTYCHPGGADVAAGMERLLGGG